MLMWPLTSELLRVPVAGPGAVQVKVNGVAASCASLADNAGCSYRYSGNATGMPALASAMPQTLDFTSGAAALTLTLAGSGFGASAAAVSVTVGRAACTVTAVTDASVTCRLAAGAARAGVRPVAVVVRPIGQATGNVTVTVRSLAASGVSASKLSASGVSLLNISGSGFDAGSCDNNHVTVAGVRCAVAACNASSLTAVYPGGAAAGPAAVRVAVVDDSGAELDATSISVADSSLQLAADGPAVTDVTVPQAPLPAAGGAVTFTLSAGTSFSSVAAAYLLPAFSLDFGAGVPAATVVAAAVRGRRPLVNLTSTDGQACSGSSPLLRPGRYLLLVEGAAGWQSLGSAAVDVVLSISSVSPNVGTIGGGTLLTIQVGGPGHRATLLLAACSALLPAVTHASRLLS